MQIFCCTLTIGYGFELRQIHEIEISIWLENYIGIFFVPFYYFGIKNFYAILISVLLVLDFIQFISSRFYRLQRFLISQFKITDCEMINDYF